MASDKLLIAQEKTKQEVEITKQRKVVAEATVRVFIVVMFLIFLSIVCYQYIVRCGCP